MDVKKVTRSTERGTGEAIERALVPLGVGYPRGDLSSALLVALANPAEAAGFLRRHRVVGLGLRRLAEVEPALPAPLMDLLRWRHQLDAMLDAGWQELQAAVVDTGVATVGIKGLSMRGAYEHRLDRDAGDLDIMVHTVDDAWQLASWLRERGYDWCEYEWPWLKRDVRTQRIYGQFQVWKPQGGEYLRFDIHFGGYSVRHCRLAACTPSTGGLSLLEPAANLACLLGNSSGDFLIRLKDVNDVAVLLRNGHLAPEATVETVRHLGLGRFWNTLIDRVAAEVSLTEPEHEALRSLRVDRRPRQRVPFGVASPRARTVATVLDAFAYGQALAGPLRGLRVALPAWSYYRKKHELKVGACAHDGPSTLIPAMTNETCVRLVPTRLIDPDTRTAPAAAEIGSARRRDIPGTSLLTEVVTDHHAFIDGGGERLVPTISYHLCAFEAAGGSGVPTT
jgi:hypothetical protein